MPLSYATPPGDPQVPDEIDLPAELKAAPFVCAWSSSALHGYERPLRIGGVFVESADVVLGLRSWNDAREGRVDAVPYALFEVEKIARMMLHQSGLAFEILASPAVFESSVPGGDGTRFPARRMVNAAVTQGLVHHYRDIADGMLARFIASKGQGARVVDIFELVRNALVGEALMQGEVDFNLVTLLANHATPKLAGYIRNTDLKDLVDNAWIKDFARTIESALESLVPEHAALPTSPSDYAWLHDFVITSRLEQLENRTSRGPS